MIALFARSLWFYLTSLAQSFFPDARRVAPLSRQRVLILIFGFPPFIALQAIHWFGFLLDECFFRNYRRVRVESPLFITGVPRSGTTFVHRAMALDDTGFTTFRTWEAILAPSVTERRLWKCIARIDRLLGGHVQRLMRRITRHLTGDFDQIHEVGLEAPEEDYLVLLPVASCFILVLAFPFAASLWKLGNLAELSPKRRQQILAFYRLCVQKHLYEEGDGRTFLSKNAAFGTWIPALREVFPDARFLVCVRSPEDALSSQLSSLESGRRLLGTDPEGEYLAARFGQHFGLLYTALRETCQNAPPHFVTVIDQKDLRSQPRDVLQAAFATFGVSLSPAVLTVLDIAAADGQDSKRLHRHRAADREFSSHFVNPALESVYRELLDYRSPFHSSHAIFSPSFPPPPVDR